MLRHLITFIYALHLARSAHRNRHDEMNRMKQYSLLTLSPETVDEDTRIIEFEAFDQRYIVELTRKHEWAPSSVRHSNVDPDVHAPLSSQRESCHFSGRVLNDEGPSMVSASLCYGRGVRARISAFNDTVILKPSAYYLDLEKDRTANHSIYDEVLIYRLSDFEEPEIMVTERTVADDAHSLHSDAITMDESAVSVEGLRRRMFSASSPAYTEVTVMIGPVRTKYYQDFYGTSWYNQLYWDTADMINAVDVIYRNTNWNANYRNSVGGVNSLRVVMSTIYVLYNFDGIHRPMAPEKRYPSKCTLGTYEYDDSDDCAIYGDEWLNLIQDWMDTADGFDTDDYDNVQVLTDIKFNWTPCASNPDVGCARTVGWGSVGTMCHGSGSTSADSIVWEDRAVGTIAHELGHNFGLKHDGQSGPASHCGANDGLMGYGSNHDTFSTCSLDLMEEYYRGFGFYAYPMQSGDYLQCLGTGWNTWDVVGTNVDDGNSANPSPTASPVNGPSYPTIPPVTPSDTGCISVQNLGDNFDGIWTEITGGYNGEVAYEFENDQGVTKYLYFRQLTWTNGGYFTSNWNIAESLGAEDNVNMVCTQHYLDECNGNWKYSAGGGWGIVSNSIIDSENCQVPVDDGCDTPHSRLCVSSSGDSGEYDGYYDAAGCHNGQRYYRGVSGNALTGSSFLCYGQQSASGGQWTITQLASDSVCDRGDVISQTVAVGADVLTPTYWLYWSGGSAYHDTLDTDMLIFDCSNQGNGAFGDDELNCLEEKEYDDEICFSSNHTLWSGHPHRTFTVNKELCSNDEPVYHYVLFNDSRSLILPSGDILSADIEATFYLHYELVYRTVTDNETVGQWWISKNEMNKKNRIGFCDEENLMDCSSKKWVVTVTEQGIDGTIYNLLDEFTSVRDGHCDLHFDARSEDETDGLSAEGIVAVVSAVVVLCFVGVAALCWWRRNKYQQFQNDESKIQQSAGILSTDDGHEMHAVKAEDGDGGVETTEISVQIAL